MTVPDSPLAIQDPAGPEGRGVTERDAKLPFGFCKQQGVLVCRASDPAGAWTLFCRPDARFEAVIEARRVSGRPLRLQPLGTDDFTTLLHNTYEKDSDQASEVVADLGQGMDLEAAAQSLAEPADLLDSTGDAPIIRLINALLATAIRDGASDIHIEPFENRLLVRFRVDGELRNVLEPPPALLPLIVSRIKVMARLDISEKRLPLDGRIALRIAGRGVDVRVSTLPSGYGERVVMRLLDKQRSALNLKRLGMNPENRNRLERLVREPHGIILVTGPTGSGKTTTLYAALGEINSASRNIMTVEDPIEYYVEGIAQVQVNPRVDLTFARGLRAILRQDPDVVMVGEIRDLETSQIAVQASLTGHLVLSTLHTNTALGAITRLRDMGVEPFLLSSSLIAVIAQRLVRVLCSHCKVRGVATAAEREFLRSGAPVRLYRETGCPHCNFSGFRGRSGIYELIPVDDQLRRMIHDQCAESALEQQAHSRYPAMLDSGREKILAGETTVQEVLRVTRQT